MSLHSCFLSHGRSCRCCDVPNVRLFPCPCLFFLSALRLQQFQQRTCCVRAPTPEETEVFLPTNATPTSPTKSPNQSLPPPPANSGCVLSLRLRGRVQDHAICDGGVTPSCPVSMKKAHPRNIHALSRTAHVHLQEPPWVGGLDRKTRLSPDTSKVGANSGSCFSARSPLGTPCIPTSRCLTRPSATKDLAKKSHT